MADQVPGESAVEVVLDNRRLILVFAVLMVLCAVFFVLGFVEGKRQGTKLEADKSARMRENLAGVSEPEVKTPTGSSAARPIEERPVRDQLDWYKNVNQKTQPASKLPAPESTLASGGSGTGAPAPTQEKLSKVAGAPPKPNLTGRPVPSTYWLQIGAFSKRHEAETAAAALKAKGYSCTINPPTAPETLYRLKVGKFDSRADAIALQLKLKKDGFATLIKTN